MQFRPLLVAAAALIAMSAQAATSNFSGSIDAGPLSGATFSGSFSFDAGQITGADFEQIALSAFTLNFNAQTFTLTPGATADYGAGVFLGLSYTTAGSGYTLTMTSGSVDLSDAFLHYQPGNGLESSGGYAISAVPELQSHALLLGGLGLIGLLARRRRA